MTFPDAFQFFLDLTTRYISPQAVAAEWVLVGLSALAIVTVLARLRLGGLTDAFRKISANRRLAIALSFVLPVGIRLSLIGIMPVPNPSIHDEFSHLLLGDTLAHGRLANPAHPLWQHFESIHILQQPTYASMYQPAQGAFLAFGQVIFGLPWAGVVLSVGIMCAALCWMLQAWLPEPWAFFGTLLVIVKICLTGVWINSYLGGSPSTIGAAFVLGAAGYRKHPLLFGFGAVLLMNSRPFEGAFLVLAALAYLYWQKAVTRMYLVRAGAVLLIGVVFSGYYNFRVTGSPLTLPYMVNRNTYGWPENLGFLPPKKLAPLRHQPLEMMRQVELGNHSIYKDPKLFLQNFDTKLFDNWTYFLGPLLTIPLFFIRRGPRTNALLIFLAVLFSLNLLQMVLYPYHLGPAVPLLFALVTIGIRAMYGNMLPARGHAFALGILAALLVLAAMKEFSPELRIPLTYWERAREPHGDLRAGIEAWLRARSGQQLVIVRYSPTHNPTQEWVYNGADIDGSKIVWAREMEDNSKLLTYFAGRTKWLLEADGYPPRVMPYPISHNPGE